MCACAYMVTHHGNGVQLRIDISIVKTAIALVGLCIVACYFYILIVLNIQGTTITRCAHKFIIYANTGCG